MENREKIVRETEAFVRCSVPKTRQPEEAYLRHVFGARNYARHLAEIYHADIFTVIMAALLHDIGADAGDEKHAKESVKIAKQFLEEFKLDKRTRDKIFGAIKAHPLGTPVEGMEQRILQDADGIIFIEDTYKSYFDEQKKNLAPTEAKARSIEKTRAMMGKIKTDEGIKIANKFLESAMKHLENAF
ncbi:MAG: HD domain-containing protein [Nanoarchaeota archaeon]|nr:HD domain-containing protein [Nanoarchaeota archaeon]MBU4452532.1 HD domain-containing protein [Nanoarchaeota archaeon]MCG2723237.1 HD domain-containing protein [archaeon]